MPKDVEYIWTRQSMLPTCLALGKWSQHSTMHTQHRASDRWNPDTKSNITPTDCPAAVYQFGSKQPCWQCRRDATVSCSDSDDSMKEDNDDSANNHIKLTTHNYRYTIQILILIQVPVSNCTAGLSVHLSQQQATLWHIYNIQWTANI